MTKQMPFRCLLDEDILYNYQSGFQGNHSTNICLSFSTDKVFKGFDDGNWNNINWSTEGIWHNRLWDFVTKTYSNKILWKHYEMV